MIQTNGLALIADDAGDKTASAEFLGATYPISKTRMITTAADVDFFKFNLGAGSATVTVEPAPNQPNLDVAIELLNSKGKALAKDAPASGMSGSEVSTGMGASVTATVTAGTHFLKVSGVGNGSKTAGYSDYGSVGVYEITITGTSGAGLTNILPAAKITTAATTIGFPGPATFDSFASTDADGMIDSASWNFGDGTADAAGKSVAHTFTTAGSFTVTMVVTDNSGGTATKTLKVKTVPAVTTESVEIAKEAATGGKYKASATVTIVDADGEPVAGANVSVTWMAGTKKSSGSGKTDADGIATVKGPTALAGTVTTATVTKATKTAMAYNAAIADEITATTTL